MNYNNIKVLAVIVSVASVCWARGMHILNIHRNSRTENTTAMDKIVNHYAIVFLLWRKSKVHSFLGVIAFL